MKGRLAHGTAGIAHLLEHMAFKGSQRIGARDYKREAVLLEAVDNGKPAVFCFPSQPVLL